MDATWPGLELRHLVALVAVADAGTISRAAEALGYTQSAVSQQVAALEKVVGAPVFDRPGGPRPLRLTEAGETLLAHARSLLVALRDAEADVRAVTLGERGTLRVGTIQSAGTRILPSVLRRFHAERPGVEVRLNEAGDSTELLGLLEAGELDVTFCEEDPGGAVETRLVLEDPIVLLVPADSPEAAMLSVPVEHVATLPLVGYRETHCCRVTTKCLEPLDVAPNYVFRSDDNTTVQGCVGAGLGYALVPLLAVDLSDRSTVVRPLSPAAPPRELALAWHTERRRPPSLDSFVEIVADVCTRLSPSLAVA